MSDRTPQLVRPVAEKLRLDTAAEQDLKGLAKYGRPLLSHNGRDPLADLRQEIYDAEGYAAQALMEREADRAEIARLKAELAAVRPTIKRLTARVLELTMRPRT